MLSRDQLGEVTISGSLGFVHPLKRKVESEGRGGRGYVDSNLASSVSSIESSILRSIKREVDLDDTTTGLSFGAHYSTDQSRGRIIVGPGKIAVKTLLDIEFPRGHIGVKSFDVEVVDEVGDSVPLYETYLHHWFAVKYIENITMSPYIKQSHDLRNGIEFERNDGACQGFLLPHYWGLGGESRGT
ncbi:uncharacterized protein HKW66_Vig0203640 [Vigna angularis]|uniref:Uncharacterized protein n=1 Tax=Phaseolus angularis TaxID=3914 RepID=A0A8T0JT52_PHAAN|nr:uncharacterized protein HKW66_Vig0203640 [Vigna angularis]